MKFWILIFALAAPVLFTYAEEEQVSVLLIGDSTTEGSIPRLTDPEGPHLEQTIRQLLSLEPDMPALKVYNLGQNGDTAFRLLDSGRYDREVATHEDADFIFVRYGINDWSRRAPVEKNFPGDLRAVLRRLKTDFPDARIVPMTIIPCLDEEKSGIVNKMIYEVSKKEGLEVFDIYLPYSEALEAGPNLLNYRRYRVNNIPDKFHEWIAPRVYGGRLVVMDNEFDAMFGHLSGWYSDRHPNLAGYNVIAVETVKYLVPLIREKS
jgi:lysophospholipase L1-like esterase